MKVREIVGFMKAKYLVVVERGDKNCSAFSPDLPGCVATGETIESTIENMREAIPFHLEGMIENGETIPRPRNLYFYIHESDEISENDILTTVEADVPEVEYA